MQLFAGAMGPPGGGRNDITGRFTRHLQIVSIDEFDDNTMTRIFTSISDWHFAKGFEGSFARLGKVLLHNYTILNIFEFVSWTCVVGFQNACKQKYM